MDSSLPWTTHEGNKVSLLAGCQVLQFGPPTRLGWLRMNEVILKDHKTHSKKKEKIYMYIYRERGRISFNISGEHTDKLPFC